MVRRVLANWRLPEAEAKKLLPDPLRPRLHQGWAVGGICLLKLADMRPKGMPAALGLSSDNAAHRIAVEWDEGGSTHYGVFVPHRDTSSWLQATFGSCAFTGEYDHADFQAQDQGDEHEIVVSGERPISYRGRQANALPPGSIFDDLTASSQFFAESSAGFSPGKKGLDRIDLVTPDWQVEALKTEIVNSAYFDPIPGAEFDHALLMADILHQWVEGQPICMS